LGLNSCEAEIQRLRLRNFFTSDHHEDYVKRLIPLIPFVPYRINDKIEKFHLNFSIQGPSSTDLNLCLSERFVKGKIPFDSISPNLFSIPWTHIYIKIIEDTEILSYLYNFISEIYTQKKYKTYIQNLKLNPSYSLIRDYLEVSAFKIPEFSETYKSKCIKFLGENPPAIILGFPENSQESKNTLIL
jgi:hypothetical protein